MEDFEGQQVVCLILLTRRKKLEKGQEIKNLKKK